MVYCKNINYCTLKSESVILVFLVKVGILIICQWIFNENQQLHKNKSKHNRAFGTNCTGILTYHFLQCGTLWLKLAIGVPTFFESMKDNCRVWICDYADTLCFCLKDGLIWLISMLHSNGMWELIQHSLLEGLQPFIVMSSANKFLILSRIRKKKEKKRKKEQIMQK